MLLLMLGPIGSICFKHLVGGNLNGQMLSLSRITYEYGKCPTPSQWLHYWWNSWQQLALLSSRPDTCVPWMSCRAGHWRRTCCTLLCKMQWRIKQRSWIWICPKTTCYPLHNWSICVLKGILGLLLLRSAGTLKAATPCFPTPICTKIYPKCPKRDWVYLLDMYENNHCVLKGLIGLLGWAGNNQSRHLLLSYTHMYPKVPKSTQKYQNVPKNGSTWM